MTTKKHKRQFAKRRQRRVLNKALDFFKAVSGHRLNKFSYHDNVSRGDVRTTDHDDED